MKVASMQMTNDKRGGFTNCTPLSYIYVVQFVGNVKVEFESVDRFKTEDEIIEQARILLISAL